MDWADEVVADALIGRPQGRIDEASWEAFLAGMNDAVARAGDAGLRFVIDLSRVDYMTSRGLRVLSVVRRAADARGTAMMLAAPNMRMREILEFSRYDKIFDVAPTLDAALAGSVKG